MTSLLKSVGRFFQKMGEAPVAIHGKDIANTPWPKWNYALTKKARDSGFFIAPNSEIDDESKLEVGQGSGVWYGTKIEGKTIIGEGSSVLENSTIKSSTIGNKVMVFPRAVLNSCNIGDNSYIGAGAVLEDGVEVKSTTWIAAGAKVPKGTKCLSGGIYAGSPATRVREMTSEEVAYITDSANYATESNLLHGKYAGFSANEVGAFKWYMENMRYRNPKERFAAHPSFLTPPDQGGPFYDRVEDEKFGGPKNI